MAKIHYKDIFTKKSDCGKEGDVTLNIEEVNCMKCLKLNKNEWERQVKKFSGQPKINAIIGLEITKKRIQGVFVPTNSEESK